MIWRYAAAACLATAVAGCTTGDGEGPRYIGRVTSVSADTVCVGPSSSSDSETCGKVPEDPPSLPKVGQCVGLFPSDIGEDGRVLTWSKASLSLHYDDSECDG
jgi:hypothetical protein